MEDKIKLLLRDLGEIRVKVDIDLAEHIQSGLGGLTRAFYIATSQKELIKAVEVCRELRIGYLVIGTGSKIAIASSGFDGLVIKNRNDGIRIFGIRGKVSKLGLGVEEASLEVGSGRSVKSLIEYVNGQGLSGLEQLEHLPGSVGGNFYFNHNVQLLAQQVSVYTKNGAIKTKTGSEVGKDDIILSVVIRLKAK